jgi:CubicO group peptidase (beta-lactamase class C family)
MKSIFTILALTLFFGSLTAAENPRELSKSYWQISTPEEQGLDSEILLKMLKNIKDEELKIRGIIIIRNGFLILESYIHPYNRHTMHDVKSVSKSIISALAGIALREGILKNLDQTVYEFFPDYFSGTEPRKKEIDLRHLLSMASGLDIDENGPVMGEIMTHNDLIRATFDRPMITNPGEEFTYCTLLTHTMAGIMAKASGMDLLELSKKYLFNPLGINSVHWEKDPQGLYFGGDKLWLTPVDMAKFGFLFLNEGKWDNQQTVPEDWVIESTTSQFKSFDTQGYDGYGYGWWLMDDNSYYARGFGGQIISIYPEQQMIVVFTGADNNRWRQLTDTYILPAVKGNKSLPKNINAQQQILKIVNELMVPVPHTPLPLPEIAKSISGKTYILEENELNFIDLTLWFERNDFCRLLIRDNKDTLDLVVGLDNVYRLTEGLTWGMKPHNNILALRGKWMGPDTFFVDFHEIGEPFYFDMQFLFTEDELEASLIWKPMDWSFNLKGQWK